jgi:hypothetical protein
MLSTFNVDFAYIEGKALVAIADKNLKKPSQEELYDCIVNKD